MSQGKTKPKPKPSPRNVNSQSADKAFYLADLQRLDPFVDKILIAAAPVAVYEFDLERDQWSRKNVEGSLFVVRRKAQPKFEMVVINRLRRGYVVENLMEDFEYEVQVPYLIYRNAAAEVNGIWFCNSNECEAVASLLSRMLISFSRVPGSPAVTTSQSESEGLKVVSSISLNGIKNSLEPTSSVIVASLLENFSNVRVSMIRHVSQSTPQLISLPPQELLYFGQIKVNPSAIHHSHLFNN